MSSKALKSATPAANGVVERRAHLRYKFAATFDLVANGSDNHSEGQVSDLNEQGCYVDTSICFQSVPWRRYGSSGRGNRWKHK